MNAVITHRMPERLWQRLKIKAEREKMSINELYNAIMGALADGALFVYTTPNSGAKLPAEADGIRIPGVRLQNTLSHLPATSGESRQARQNLLKTYSKRAKGGCDELESMVYDEAQRKVAEPVRS